MQYMLQVQKKKNHTAQNLSIQSILNWHFNIFAFMLFM